MKRKKFKVYYELLETGELKTIEVIARDQYETHNIIKENFNNSIFKKARIYKITEGERK